jgi:F-type H+-transporting ATPase subunit delta
MSEELLTTPRRFAKPPTTDTGVWRVANIYAAALLGATEAAGSSEAVLSEFDSLIRDVLDALPRLDAVLSSPLVDQAAKAQMLEKALAGKASALFLNFLKVVSAHGRLDLLRLIQLAAHDELDRLRGRVRVLVSTPTPLAGDAEHRIAAEIRTHVGREPVLEKQLHEDLIGGIVLRIGDRVFDGSIATRLRLIREQMIERSVHEIQSRRDRFGFAEGN